LSPTAQQIEYREVYLRSSHWRQMRELALKDAYYRCAVCNSSKEFPTTFAKYASRVRT
jgi:hypothetical protein